MAFRRSSQSVNYPNYADEHEINMDANIVLKDITFVRINLETVYMNEEDEYIAELIRKKALFGFMLEYQFPSLDSVSTSLKARIRLNAKTYDTNSVHFRHRRVVRVKMNPDIIPLWKRENLCLTLYSRLNTLGRYNIKQLGRCEVPLDELLIPPFIICRDFLFIGPAFAASALIKIDLGSHVQSLMERLECMRGGGTCNRGVEAGARRTSARSSSRSSRPSRRPSVSPSPPPPPSPPRPPQIHPIPSAPPAPPPSPPVHVYCPPPPFRPSRPSPTRVPLISAIAAPGTSSGSSRGSRLPSPIASFRRPNMVAVPAIPTIPTHCSTYQLMLTVHSARRLPLIYGPRGETSMPSTYVSVNGDDGRTLSSPVRASTVSPHWEWSEVLYISYGRQNLVIKLWRKCLTTSDKVIGFVSIPLPPKKTERAEYEMSDLSASEHTPLITISIRTVDVCSSSRETPLLDSSPRREVPSHIAKISREEISEKLRRNMGELEMMMADLRRH